MHLSPAYKTKSLKNIALGAFLIINVKISRNVKLPTTKHMLIINNSIFISFYPPLL
jgi:hypothetical protein